MSSKKHIHQMCMSTIDIRNSTTKLIRGIVLPVIQWTFNATSACCLSQNLTTLTMLPDVFK